MPNGWSVRLFQNDDYYGPQVCIQGNDSNLWDNYYNNGNVAANSATWLEVYSQSTCPAMPPSTPGNFHVSGTSNAVNFTVNNPVPTLTTLSPSSATAGGIAFTLTVNGTNFVNGSVVRWNGSARTTTYVSPTQLTTAITAADIASAGTFPVTVFNPTPGGGTSNAVNFTIQAATYPDLIVQSITPSLSSPALNQPVTFTVRIKNQGNADITSSFYLDFYIDTAPGSCPSDGIHWWSVSSLAAGSTQDLTYDYEGFTYGDRD